MLGEYETLKRLKERREKPTNEYYKFYIMFKDDYNGNRGVFLDRSDKLQKFVRRNYLGRIYGGSNGK